MFSNKFGWIGVDLGTHTVKLAQAVRTTEGVRLRHAAVIQRPAPWSEADALAVDEPDPSWPEILAALECGGFHGRSAACVLPMNVCELRGLKVPPGDEQERHSMIAGELAGEESAPSLPTEFDYWEIGGEKGIETTDGFNVNVMSVTRPWIDRVAADCQQARLDCWAVDGAPLAMARAVSLASGAERRAGRGRGLGLFQYNAVGGRPRSAALFSATSQLLFSQVPGGDRASARRDAGPCPASGGRARRARPGGGR